MKPSETQLRQQILAHVQMTAIIADTIQELKEVPSGHLYARVMGSMSLEMYNFFIDTLIKSKVVRRDPSHLLVWIGPKDKVMPGVER
jgi:hypothetical protein